MDLTVLALRVREFFTLKTTADLEHETRVLGEVEKIRARIERHQANGITPATQIFTKKREEEIHFARHMHDQVIKLFEANGLQHCIQYPYATDTAITTEWPDIFKIKIVWAASTSARGVYCAFSATMSGGDKWKMFYNCIGPGINCEKKDTDAVPFDIILRTPFESWFKDNLLQMQAYVPEDNRNSGPLPKAEAPVTYPPLEEAPIEPVTPTPRETVAEPVEMSDAEWNTVQEEAAEALLKLQFKKATVKRMMSLAVRGDSAKTIITKALTIKA